MITLRKIHVWGIISIISMLLITSCSQDDELPTVNPENSNTILTEQEEAIKLATTVNELRILKPEVKAQRKAAILLSEYVSLNGDEYSLDISLEEAKSLGISADMYNKIVSDLEVSNTAIKNAIKNGNQVELIDIKKAAKAYKNKNYVEVTTTRSSSQSGRISTDGNEFGTQSFYPDYSKAKVRFRCRTGAALAPVYTCKTFVFQAWNAKVATGSLFTTTQVDVPLAASGSSLCADLYFQTTDSNGGSADWEALP